MNNAVFNIQNGVNSYNYECFQILILGQPFVYIWHLNLNCVEASYDSCDLILKQTFVIKFYVEQAWDIFEFDASKKVFGEEMEGKK
jgi:hypothetical protein